MFWFLLRVFASPFNNLCSFRCAVPLHPVCVEPFYEFLLAAFAARKSAGNLVSFDPSKEPTLSMGIVLGSACPGQGQISDPR